VPIGPPGRRPALAATLVVSAALAVACGSNNTTGGAGASPSSAGGITATKVASIASELPSSIASKGTLTIAADASYAPNEFFDADGKTVIGMDADLAKAIGQVMGVQVSVVNATFDSILPGLASGKYDLGMSSFTDTKDREKTVDFVDYFSAGTSFFVLSAGGPNITKLDDLCGHKVSVEKGTTQETDATGQDKTCKTAGKPGVDVQSYPDQGGANLALSSGRADVSMADSPVAAYQVKQNSKFKLSGQPYGTAPYGIAIPKGNGMSKPMLDAVNELIKDGVYKNILDKWGVASGAVTTAQANGATS
jgi:polar amino acid transport system substrate-binding protein